MNLESVGRRIVVDFPKEASGRTATAKASLQSSACMYVVDEMMNVCYTELYNPILVSPKVKEEEQRDEPRSQPELPRI
jgi:hypothetical protein